MRTIAEIAREIAQDWKQPYFGAVPYLHAMGVMTSVRESYGDDDGREVILYFLGNATTWRGPVARRIKAELKTMLKGDRS